VGLSKRLVVVIDPATPTLSTMPGLAQRSLALAALVASAHSVNQVAQGHHLPIAWQDYLLGPVLARSSDSVNSLLPSGAHRAQLLRITLESLTGTSQSPRVLGYVVEILELAARLRNHRSVANNLGVALDALSSANPAALAEIYQHSISTLGRRIQVTGEPQALQQPEVADLVRGLLLAGIRYAWLWHQLGGRRWHLIVQRKRTLQWIRQLQQHQARANQQSD